MKTIYYWTVVVAVAGLLVFPGCKTAEEAGEETGEAVEEVAEETEDVAGEVAEETVEAADEAEDIVDTETTASISAVGGSGLSGNADLSVDAGQGRIELELLGTFDPAGFMGMLHQGSCASPGSMVVHLSGFVAEAGGIESTTTFPASQLVEGQPYAVVVHDQAGAIVACGDLPSIDL